MPEVNRCPSPDDLHRFLLGQVEDAEAVVVQDHLSGCGQCLDTVANLKTEDTLLAAVRAQADAVADPDEAVVEGLVHQLSGLHRLPPDATMKLSNEPGSSEPSLAFLTPPQEPGELGRLGPYRVLKVLGIGGMGIVFEAEDTSLRRRVALKVMKPGLAADAVNRQRFLREAQAAAAIEHDHIVTIHQVGEEQGIPYFAQQLLKGETLDDRLKREGTPSLSEVLRIGREIAEGLSAAHAHDLVHRDIKPGNIWLEERGGRTKILDFGLVRAGQDDPRLTQTGVIAGTPQYMAPEQASGQAVDHRSDLFSLGCVLYRMCTGRLPFEGSNTLAVLRALAVEQPRSPRQVNPRVPSALSELILQLLDKNPRQRPASASAISEALAAIERDLVERTKRPQRRVAMAAALALLIATAGIVALCGPATIYRFATNQGQLVIETVDPDVEINVTGSGGQFRIADLKTGRELTLKAGKYELELTAKDGLTLSTREFTLERGGQQIVKVRYEPTLVKPAAAPAAVVAVPATGQSPPFVILAGGDQSEQKFNSLADAVAAAASGDTIEIRGNGPFVTRLVNIGGKRSLVIRAGSGFEPVLQADRDGSEKNTSLIFTDGPLVLEGLHFKHVEDPARKDGYYVFVRCYDAPLSVTHCRFFMKTGRNSAAINTEQSARVQVRHCEFAGAFGMALSWGQPVGMFQRLEMTDNLCWGTGGLVIYHHHPQATPREISLRIHRNTFVGFGVVSPYYSQLPEPPPGTEAKPFNLDLRDNVLDSEQCVLGLTPTDAGKFQPEADQKLLPRLMAFSETKNLYTGTLLRIVQHGGTPKVDFFKNVSDWEDYWGLKDTGSLQGRLRYQGGNVRARKTSEPDTLTAADFRLHTISDGKGEGANSRDLGADVDQVGPGKAYEQWKITPSYANWLNSTGQVVDAEPFVLLAPGGRREFKFANLVEASDFARAGDTIEVRGNGPFVTGAVKITGKALTVRAGLGFAPVIQLDQAAIKMGAALLETDAALTLEGLDLQRIGKDDLPDEFPRKIVLSRQAPLRLAHCRFLMQGVMPSNNAVIAEQSPLCEVRNCFFAGGPLVALYWSRPPGGQMFIENCLVSAQNFGLVVWQGGWDSGSASIQLKHNTFLASCPFQFTFAERGATRVPAAVPMRVEASDNVFDAVGLAGFQQYLGEGSTLGFEAGQSRLRELMAWHDQRNLYRALEGYLTIQHNAPPPPADGRGPQATRRLASLLGGPGHRILGETAALPVGPPQPSRHQPAGGVACGRLPPASGQSRPGRRRRRPRSGSRREPGRTRPSVRLLAEDVGVSGVAARDGTAVMSHAPASLAFQI